jgi:hypothetical protein
VFTTILKVIDSVADAVCGDPDPARICTSHIERQNLSICMGMRRMTRLTNAFSKKWENLNTVYALWFAFYNLWGAHQSRREPGPWKPGLRVMFGNSQKLSLGGFSGVYSYEELRKDLLVRRRREEQQTS